VLLSLSLSLSLSPLPLTILVLLFPQSRFFLGEETYIFYTLILCIVLEIFFLPNKIHNKRVPTIVQHCGFLDLCVACAVD
jgi:hypothetical protein